MMALTLEKQQRLERVGLIAYFQKHQNAWTSAAKDAYDYIEKGFNGATVRQDDVAPSLLSVVEIDPDFQKYLNENKLSQQYWKKYFVEYVLDATWDQIT